MTNDVELINAIIEKTKNDQITWGRVDNFSYSNNRFLYSFFSENDMAMDIVNTYEGVFGSGRIFLTNQKFDNYLLLLVQPTDNTDLTAYGKHEQLLLEELEYEVKEKIDNPRDYLSALLN